MAFRSCRLRCQATDTATNNNKQKGSQRTRQVNDRLKSWLSENGAGDQPLELKDAFKEGRGLAATRGIKKNEAILNIPQSVILTPKKAVAHLGEEANELSEWSQVAAMLASEREKGDGSEYEPYISSLPDYSGGCLEWPEEDLLHLSGSAWLDEAKARRQSVTDAIDDIQQTFPRLPGLDSSSLTWAFSMLFSRLLRIGGGEGEIALVPWADMVNHSTDTVSYIRTENSSIRNAPVVLRPDSGYGEGEQMMATYGEKPSGELLISYGFVPPETSPNETVPMAFGLSENDPMLGAKRRALGEYGKEESVNFLIKMDGIPETILPFAAFAASEFEKEKDVFQFASVCFKDELRWKDSSFALGLRRKLFELAPRLFKPSSLGREHDIDARRTIADQCTHLLSQYPTSFDEDKLAARESAQGRPAETQEDRKACAAAVRFRERAVLSRIEYIMRSEVTELRSRALSLPW